jgi:putative hydrolase of the HAD superfamily
MNIIFDLGGVIFSWNPAQIIQKVFTLPDEQDIIKSKLFDHTDWHDLDRGTLDRTEAIQRAIGRTGFPPQRIEALFEQIPYALVPIPETLQLVQQVKQAGHKLFVLSNMHLASFHRLEREYPIWDLFDGKVISCHIKLIKPEPEIYQFILKEYGLRPEETIFIDDTEVNLHAAAQLGITTIKFSTAEQCREALRQLKCL